MIFIELILYVIVILFVMNKYILVQIHTRFILIFIYLSILQAQFQKSEPFPRKVCGYYLNPHITSILIILNL